MYTMHSIAAATSSPSAAAAATLCCRASSTATAALTASAASSTHRGRRPHHPPARHISRSRRADSPPSATPHTSHGHGHGHHPMVPTTEGVLNLISKLSNNLHHMNTGSGTRVPAASPHDMPSYSNSPFPSTTSSAGLSRQPVLPSFTPSSASSPVATTSYLPSPPPMARKAEALSKLNAVDLGPGTGASLGQANDVSLASAMGAFGVAGSSLTSAAAAALPQYHAQPQELKIDMSFLERVLKLEEPLAPSSSSAASSTLDPATLDPATPAAQPSAVPTFSTATDADWDALFSTTTLSSTSSAPTQPATAANQLPDLTHLTSHLQSVKSRTSARSSTLSLLARIPSASSSLASGPSPMLPPRLSTDDLNSLRIHLRASSTSPIHLRAFLATLFTHLPLPPSAIVADAIQAAANLHQPGLAHAIVAQIRRDHGLLGLVTCVSPLAFEHLVTLAWEREASMPRVVKWMYEMQSVGVKPTPGLAGLLDVLLARCTAPAAIEAQVGAVGAGADAGQRVPTEHEANWLWTVLCEVNWTRYLASARVSLDKASESGSMVRGRRVPRDLHQAAGARAGDAREGHPERESPLFSSQSLADLMRSAGVGNPGLDDLGVRQNGEQQRV